MSEATEATYKVGDRVLVLPREDGLSLHFLEAGTDAVVIGVHPYWHGRSETVYDVVGLSAGRTNALLQYLTADELIPAP